MKNFWIGCLLFLALFIFAEYLPFSIQRSLAWIPGIEISKVAALSAANTTSWRIELWTYLLDDISRYWLVGKGLTFDAVFVGDW